MVMDDAHTRKMCNLLLHMEICVKRQRRKSNHPSVFSVCFCYYIPVKAAIAVGKVLLMMMTATAASAATASAANTKGVWAVVWVVAVGQRIALPISYSLSILYMRVCPSVGRSVRRSDGRMVGP